MRKAVIGFGIGCAAFVCVVLQQSSTPVAPSAAGVSVSETNKTLTIAVGVRMAE